MTTNKRTIAILLAAVLALSLLLTACSKGGDAPTGDNSMSGTSSTPTETPSNTPGTSDPTDTTAEPPRNDSTIFNDSLPVNEKVKSEYDNSIIHYNNIAGIDINKSIDKIYEQYDAYLNENITKSVVRCAVISSAGAPFFDPSGANLTGVSPESVKKVNDFLKEKGEEPLDEKNAEQNIVAIWLAASLYYDPDYVYDYDYTPHYDIAMAIGLARADSTAESAEDEANDFWSIFASLYSDAGVFDLVE